MLQKGKKTRAFFLFFSFSLLSYLGILYWIPGIMINHGGVSPFLSILGLLLLAVFLSLFTGLAGIMVEKALFKTPYSLYLIPLIWVGKDLVLEKILSGFPWALAGYSQAKNLYFIQVAEFGGIHLITALVIMINIFLFQALKDRRRQPLIALLIAIVSLYSTGYFLVKAQARTDRDLPVHRAGIIQPNYMHELIYGEIKQQKLDHLFALSRQLAAQGAEFVIWPEYTVPMFPLQNTHELSQFRRFAAGYVPIIAGFDDYEEKDRFYNTAFVFAKEGVEKYHKVHLTPFGEYIPFRKFLFMVKSIVSEIGDFSFGKDIRPLTLNGHRVATPICYEIIFPELVRAFIARGGELIITISNDSWVGDTSSPAQIFYMAVFRAVENRRYLLRATSTGISALIAPGGEIIYRSAWAREDRFTADFTYRQQKTVFTVCGYLFPYLCLAFLVFYFTLLPGLRQLSGKKKKISS